MPYDLDTYTRANLDEEANAVIHAAQRFCAKQTDARRERLEQAVNALAEAYADWLEAVEEFKRSNGEPADLTKTRGGMR